jgi:acetaldehyde dehydrogenase
MLQDASFEVVAFVGRRADSPGIRMFENQVKYSISNGIEGLVPFLNEIEGVFDATSAFDHQRHWEILSKAGKWVIDLTPSKIGLPIVPVLMNKTPTMHLQSENSSNYSMVTCGGQSSAPLLFALTLASTGISEVEVSSSIAALSAGPATRLNIDQYIESTENLTSIVSGCSNVKAILVVNPAEPPVMMRTTVNMAIDTCDLKSNSNDKRINQGCSKLRSRIRVSGSATYAESKNGFGDSQSHWGWVCTARICRES